MSLSSSLRAICLASMGMSFALASPTAHAWEALEDGLDHLLIDIGQWAAGVDEKAVEIRPGCALTYYDNGNTEAPETLVLLHGFSANKDMWLRMAASMKTYRVLMPDLPGHGHSCHIEADTHDIPYYADAIHTWWKTLGLGAVHVAGNSMGGWVSARLAIDHPAMLKSLALMDAAGVNSPVQSAFSRAQANGDNVFFFSDKAGYDRLSHMAMVSPPSLPGLVKNAHIRTYVALQPRFRKLFADITDQDGFDRAQLLDAQLDQIKMPTLILWGKQDQVVDVSMAKVYADGIADSEVFLLDNVGHVPMVEAAEATAERYAAFIEKHR